MVSDTLIVRHILEGRDGGTSQELLDLLKNPYLAQLSQAAVWAGLATSIGFTLLLAIGFSLLRPYNSVVYAPKLKIADEKHAPPPMGKGIFAWFAPLVRTKEKDLIPLIGLDATVFLRVLRMCRNLFLVLTIIGCGILIPINLSLSHQTEGAHPSLIFRITPANTYGPTSWGMATVAWLFNIVVSGFLWWNYRAVLKLRRQYYDSPEYQATLHARTLMINDIPKDFRSDEGIGRLIDEVVPTSSFSRSAIARNVKILPELIEQHDKAVRNLERHLAKYLRDPDNLPPNRPECKPSKKDPSWGSYPKGQKVDAIEYLTRRIRELEMEIQDVRTSVDLRNPLSYGFASYEAIEEAHSIAFAARNKHPQGTTIVLAPRPNDIIWKNMPLSKKQRKIRRLWNNLWVLLLTFVWIVPNAFIAIFIVNLANLGQLWKGFNASLEAHTTWWAIVQGVASPALTSLVYLILPIIFRRLAIRAGDRTKTARERHVTGKLYTFFIFNFLIVFSLFSTVWTFVSSVISNTANGTDAWDAIKEADFATATFVSLCNVSPFWITWLLQRNLGAAVDIAQLWSLIWSFCTRKFSNPTPRDMIELTAPPAFDYASYYNYFLFYSTVTLCYAIIQPLVIPAATIYFALDVYLKKYLLLYIFVTKTESGGMFWRMIYNRMVFATILSNLVVFLAVWVRGDASHIQAYAVIPLPFLMIAFKIYCKRTFDDKIHYYNIRNMLKDPEATRSNIFGGKSDRLASRFGHPVLYRPLITPMVHAKAQNKLASIYGGRITDPNTPSSGDATSVSGYSDTILLDSMQTGKPGRKPKGLPGFEMVPENRLDFSYYKGRAEFGDEHGGGGGLYGKAEDLMRPDTPGGSSMWGGSDSSRPGSPMGRKYFTSPGTPISHDAPHDTAYRHPMYAHQNNSDTGLVSNAAAMPVATPPILLPAQRGRLRDESLERRPAPGFLGGGPQGYGGLPQTDEDPDPLGYDYFRGRRDDAS
ncbi:hypothetical protein B7494_g4570 [Chlorociboria aeruginascens]|nr:hypothetical protein B7494_g4570 [Chlorociboria aeruginascens]